MDQLDPTIAVAAFTVAVLGLASARLQTLPLSRPILALAIGAAAGPLALGWLRPAEWGDPHLVLKEAARFTLATSVVGVALRVPTADLLRLWRPILLLITAGMVLMWAVSSALAWTALGAAPVAALMIGAAVTPTDPVVASSIVTGRAAEHALPGRLRTTISAESGANDGLGYLIVMLPVLILAGAEPVAARFALDVALRGVVLAVAIGATLGALLGLALHRADRAGWVAKTSLLGFSIALSLLALTGAHLAGSDGILAAFAAGVAFDATIDRDEEKEEENVQEAISKLFNLPVFVLFGAMLPVAGWAGLGWGGAAFAVLVLLLRRPLALLALGPVLGGGLRGRDRAFMGWFGPVGIAAIYYALHAWERTDDPLVWHAVSLTVAASVLAHGVTSGPGLAAYRRAARP